MSARILSPLFRLLGLGLLVGLVPLQAASLSAEVRAADTRRIMATIAGDAERVAELLSDDLRYGHADGRLQSKADFLAAVRSNRMRYEAYDYEEMQIERAADDIAVITGRASLRVRTTEQHLAFRLRFLALWRNEAGVWRLLAYQSTQLPPQN
ncbi:MAG: nuclear transport factor 2 family protein [Opitutaceae bacterium]|nr:nuclear transport factor 2 family protein [Opitutaceae bacterium]